MNYRWRLHVLNRSAELRWKYGEPEQSVSWDAIQTDINIPRLRRALGTDFARLLRHHRQLLQLERQRVVERRKPEVTSRNPQTEVPIWEREPW